MISIISSIQGCEMFLRSYFPLSAPNLVVVRLRYSRTTTRISAIIGAKGVDFQKGVVVKLESLVF